MEIDKDLPFETLLQLEQKLGSKTFRDAQAASSNKVDKPLRKRRAAKQEIDSDEAPEEISSKHPTKKTFLRGLKANQTRSIDPRFNPRAGKFKEDHFRKNFEFAFDLKNKEIEQLKKSKRTMKKDSEEVEKTKYLIQRMENQKREHLKKKEKTKHILNPDGSKYFPSKKEQFAQELVTKYVELKESGKLSSHLEKRRKKQAGKERKRMQIEKT